MKSKIWNIVFNNHPFTYALIYLLLIPTYAFIYSSLSRSFYHSTVKFEFSVLKENADDILKEMKTQIQVGCKKYDVFVQDSNIPEVDFDKVELHNFNFRDSRYFFSLIYDNYNYSITKEEGRPFRREVYNLAFGTLPVSIEMDPSDNLKEISYNLEFALIHPSTDTVVFLPRENSNTLRKIFSSPKGFDVYQLKISNDFNNKLLEYMRTLSGFPTSFSDNYWRMFYFSTVTLTTLGYGDIVPLTNRARIIVSSEAILGVVLIGLFLNALSKRIKINLKDK